MSALSKTRAVQRSDKPRMHSSRRPVADPAAGGGGEKREIYAVAFGGHLFSGPLDLLLDVYFLLFTI